MTTEIIHVPPPSPAEEKELRIQLTAVCTYTLPIIVNCQSRGNPEIGTAVLIRIGNRLFAATAKHCIGDAPLLALEDTFALPAKPTPFLRCLKHPTLDIALLEVKTDITPYGCSVDNLDTSLPALPEDPRSPKAPFFWIVGYPEADHTRTGDRLSITAVSVGTQPIKLVEDSYQFSYPLRSCRVVGDSHEFGDQPDTPKGFSGGGVWRFVASEDGKLFAPGQHIRLCATQSRWRESERRAYAVPITCWIKFVYDYYPDLQDLLAARFPSLKNGE